MKKVIYIIAMALCLLSSCNIKKIEHKESDTEKEYLYLRDGRGTLTVFRFEYDGHKYILFTAGEPRNGFVHDPDCPCHELYINKGKNKQETSDYPDWW